MKMIEKEMKIMKKNVAKFLLLSSLLGGMAVAHPVSANTKAAIYEYKNGQLDLVQKPTYEGFESDQLSLKLKTGQETGVVLARLGLLSLVGLAIVILREKF